MKIIKNVKVREFFLIKCSLAQAITKLIFVNVFISYYHYEVILLYSLIIIKLCHALKTKKT